MGVTRSKSKQPSDTRKEDELRRLLKTIIFFVDRSFESNCLLEALDSAGAIVHAHRKLYPQKGNIEDVLWLPRVCREDWVILMKDIEIARNPLERETLLRSGGRAFVLKANLKGERERDIMLKALPEIIRIIKTYKKPYIARILSNSRVEVWLPEGKEPSYQWFGLYEHQMAEV